MECVVQGVNVGSGIVATAVGTGAVTSTIFVVKRAASVHIASLPPNALVSRAIRNACDPVVGGKVAATAC